MRLKLRLLFLTLGLFYLNVGMTQSQDIDIYDSFSDFEDLLSTESDSTFVINFWATWCKPCVAELPYFEKINKDFADHKVKVILVSLDFKKKLESRLIPFIEKNKIQSEVVLLADSKEQEWIDRVDPSWSGAIPITIIYNKEKRVFLEEEFSSYEHLLETFNNIYN